ncbi:MAG: hypothetical protein ABI864_00215 [Chloroflexota bacterium]
MSGSQEGAALNMKDGQGMLAISIPDQETEQRLRARLTGSKGAALAVRISAAQPADVEGHAFDLASVWVRLQLEGDDTEGHAIRVQFPTAADADRFRRNVLVAGILASSIVLGSAGAIALTSQPAANSTTDQSEVFQAPAQGTDVLTGINPATGKPWRSGFLERSDGEVMAPADAAAPVMQRPEGRGPLETVE